MSGNRISGKFKKLNGRDLAVFLLSLLLAFGIWLIHNLSLDYVRVVNVPIKASCNLEGHALVSANDAVVQARCRTTGYDLMRLEKAAKGNPVLVEFRPEDMKHKSGEQFYIVSSDLINYVQTLFGNSSSLESFITDTLKFRFPYENSRKVPVRPVCTLSFKSQYTSVGQLRVLPDSVVLYGEPYHLSNIDAVYTESFSLEDLSNSTHGEVALEHVMGVRMSDQKVDYAIDVTRFVEQQATLSISARNVPTDRKLNIYPSRAQVYFRCAFPLTTDPVKGVRFYIDYKDFANSLDGKCIPKVSGLSPDVLSYKIEPQVFECVENFR